MKVKILTFFLAPPDVHLFSKTSVKAPNKLTLTCLATGFLPPDATMHLRKSKTALPDHLVISSGIVPNGDDSYQLKGHTIIEKDTTVTYDCCVTHSALKQPIIVDWGNYLCLHLDLIVIRYDKKK